MAFSSTLDRAPAAGGTAAGAPGRLALFVMLTGTFIVVLDFFIVNVALPALQHDLGASPAMLQWVVAGYGLANAAGLVTGGRLGDLHGRRRMFMLGLALFTLASAACGLAPSAAWLVAARVLQGLAAALLQPQVLAMLGLVFTGAARARAFAAYGLAMGLAASSGQLFGGALISLDLFGLGWRSCFLINLPIGAAALVLARRTLPPLAASGGDSRLDLAGAALLSTCSVAVVLPLVQGRELGWPTWSLALLVAALPLLAAFVAHQRRLAARGGQALVAPALLADARFRAGLLAALAFFIGNASLFFVLALFLQQGLHLRPFTSGLVFTAMATGFFLASLAAPRLAERFGGAPVSRGALVLAGLPPQHAGVASGVLGMVQQSGNALGVALIGLLFYGSVASGYAHAYAVSLLFLAGSALSVAWLYRRARAAAASSLPRGGNPHSGCASQRESPGSPPSDDESKAPR